MTKRLIKSGIALFADETTLWTSNTHIDDTINTLKNDLEVIYLWFKSNRLTINWDKTNVMLISRHALSINQQMTCKSNQRKFFDHLKLLGVYMYRNLSFEKHAAVVKRKFI